MLALKPTKFTKTSKHMSCLLQKRCTKDHEHQPLVSGRFAAAALYHPKLNETLTKGIRLQKKISKSVITSVMMVPADQISAVTKLLMLHLGQGARQFEEVTRQICLILNT